MSDHVDKRKAFIAEIWDLINTIDIISRKLDEAEGDYGRKLQSKLTYIENQLDQRIGDVYDAKETAEREIERLREALTSIAGQIDNLPAPLTGNQAVGHAHALEQIENIARNALKGGA